MKLYNSTSLSSDMNEIMCFINNHMHYVQQILMTLKMFFGTKVLKQLSLRMRFSDES